MPAKPKAAGRRRAPAGGEGRGADVQILPMTVAHIPGYRDCVDIVARERRYLAQVEALPLDAIEAFLHQHLATDAPIFVAVDGPRVVGWADILPGWPEAKRHCGTLGMGVLPGYRGAHIGRRLLEGVVGKAWRNGMVRIELEVRADNTQAIRLYEAFGFTTDCVKSRALRQDGVFHDALAMSLLSAGVG